MADQTYGMEPVPGEIVVPVKLTLRREQEFEFMPDQPFAPRLRERAAEGRRAPALLAEQCVIVDSLTTFFVYMSPDEAEAIADALEAADDATICESSHPRNRGHCGSCPPCRLRAALDRLNARGAVKSAEGQPES